MLSHVRIKQLDLMYIALFRVYNIIILAMGIEMRNESACKQRKLYIQSKRF